MKSAGSMIEWSPAFETGIDEIDEQHRILVHTLNEASVKLSHECLREVADQITQDLLAYALYHFETEEHLMLQYGYPDQAMAEAELHQEQHRSFSVRVLAIREDINAGAPIEPSQLVTFLNEWLVNHILNTDKKLGAFILSKRASQADGAV